MVFSSIEFLFLFLPLFLLVQSFIPWRNLTYVLFSLAFYFAGEGWYSAVVVVSVAANYGFALLIANASGRAARRTLLAASLALNLAGLAFFKYSGFLAKDVLGMTAPSWMQHVHLPLGISFFTFHSISYLMDIYRGDARAERSFVNVALYILMFPQLIAGPILRFHTVARQLRRRVVTARHLYYGFFLFCLGLGQKVLLADTLAGVADPLFARASSLGTMEAWVAALSYSLQIYFDFSGYSHMAIGLGWITGFYFPKNFNFPYISRSITEFWRRWHMSLSRWFRDYLYIPIGGNRGGTLRTYRNLAVVFLLCGLWHGAAWTFVAWGAYHGLFLILERMGLESLLERLPAPLRHVYALLVVVAGWVLFRAENIAQAGRLLGAMFLGQGQPGEARLAELFSPEQALAFALAVLCSTPAALALGGRLLPLPLVGSWRRDAWPVGYGLGVVSAAAVLCLASAKVLCGSFSPFIYFRF